MKKLILLLALLFSFPSFTQKLPTISEKTTNLKKYEGFMPFYWDEDTGKIWLEVATFNQEFLYVSSLPAGLGSNDIGLDREIGRAHV